MRARLFLFGSTYTLAFAVVAACSSFGGGGTALDTTPEAGSDAPVVLPACPEGPKLLDGTQEKQDTHCGPRGEVVDLSTHDHCGACRHSCGASTCTSGLCAPELLLKNESVAIASVLGSTVYYVDSKIRVARAQVADANGAFFTSGILGNTTVKRLQVAKPWLYVSTSSGPQRFKLDDSAQESVPLATTEVDGLVAAVSNGYFFAWDGGVEMHSEGGTQSVPSSGTTNVVADGEFAYWTTFSDAGAAVRGPFPTVEPPLTAAAASAAKMAVDATHIYFADPTARLIRRIARVGGSLQSVTSDASQTIGDLALDGDYVYWTADHGSKDGWVVMRVAKCGGLPLMLAKDLPELTQLSFDATYVYTVKVPPTPGNLIRVAK